MNKEEAIKSLEESISNPYAFLTIHISREAVEACIKYTKEYSLIKKHLIDMRNGLERQRNKTEDKILKEIIKTNINMLEKDILVLFKE